jgi:hypothetical protein
MPNMALLLMLLSPSHILSTKERGKASQNPSKGGTVSEDRIEENIYNFNELKAV